MRKLFLFVLLSGALAAGAQDTLSISLKQADSLFLSNNLMLLAGRYKVDASKALVQQARLFNNPTLSTEWNFYNPDKDKFFDVGHDGQKIFAIEQVVSLAGRRNKTIRLAKANAQLSEFEFSELLRSLKAELHRHYLTAYFSDQLITRLDKQVRQMEGIISALETQSRKGNIPLKEVLRLKALFYEVNNERAEKLAEKYEALQVLATLLQVQVPLKVSPAPAELDRYRIDALSLPELIAKAAANRPDLKMSENLAEQADLNHSLQKRLGYPDLRIGGIYDQAGSYINNYTGISLGLDLPLFNRNQGNIRYSKAVADQFKAELKNKTTEVSNEVAVTYRKLLLVEEAYHKIDGSFESEIELLNEGYLENFQKRNISMIEFTDFFEAYNNSIEELNRLKEKRMQIYEELNYVIGEEIFR